MNVVEGYTHREIAELLGINENTSKWRLAEAKKQLREWLPLTQPLTPKGEPNRGSASQKQKHEPQPQTVNPWVPL
jgi:transposase